MEWKRLLVLVVAFVIYLCIGAAVFQAIEGRGQEETSDMDSHDMDSGESGDIDSQDADFHDGDSSDEDEDSHKVIDYRAYIKDQLGDDSCMDMEGIIALVEKLFDDQDSSPEGEPEFDKDSDPESEPEFSGDGSDWNYFNSFFFVVTIVTTIGYGHLFPVTACGKALFIFYALFGIPLCALVLAMVGDKLSDRAKALEKKVLTRTGANTEKKVRASLLALLVAVALMAFLCLPALIFTFVEEWSYGQSFYYTFVTLSTIGFGDLIAGVEEMDCHDVYQVLLSLWIFTGLTWVAVIIIMVVDTFNAWSKGCQKKAKEHEGRRSECKMSKGDVNVNGGDKIYKYSSLPENTGKTMNEETDSPSHYKWVESEATV